MERAIFLKLLTRKLASDISASDLQQLDDAANKHPELKRLEEEITAYFKAKPRKAQDVEAKLDKVWQAIATREMEQESGNSPKISRFNPPKLLRYAAAVFLLLLAGLLAKTFLPQTPTEQLLTVNSGAQNLFVTLADGTKVLLNQHSALSYNSDFGQKQRKILLKGEAFFDVVKNKAVPLTVAAGHVLIKVKGTAFNVKATDPVKNIEVALVRGLIEVSDAESSAKGLLLKPNHKLVFNAGAPIAQAQLLAMSPELESATLQWIQDTLIFKKEKLKDLVLQMELRYKVKIEIQNEQLKHKRFSGSFTDEPLKDALEALKLSYPFQYQLIGQKVIIK